MIGKATLLFVVALVLTLGVQAKPRKTDRQPNILIFYVDDLGWMDLSCQGSEFYETPAIDQLADEGIRFTQAYTAHPRCVPARYGVMTGKYPARGHVPGRGGLVADDVTIAEALKEGGYATFFTGKWHLLFKDKEGNMPEMQGFDINVAGGAAGSPPTYWYPYRKGESTPAGRKGLKKTEIHGLEDGQEGEYITDRLTDETVQFMQQHVQQKPDEPFFVFLSHYGVHTPFEAKPALVAKYKKKLKSEMSYDLPEYEKTITGDTKLRQDFPVYAAMIESIDQSMAKVCQTLEELGVADNTIIIFTADNGGLSTRGNTRQLATSNYPLRYGKGWLYEGGIREAFIVKWPGVTPQGQVSDALVTGTDIYPTVLQMAGLPQRPKDHIDGVDVTGAIKGKAFNRETPIFWHSPMGRPTSTGDRNSTAVRLGDYKLVDWYDEGTIELYNLKDDIGEQHNLAEQMPEKAGELHQLVKEWRASIDAEILDPSKNKWSKKAAH
ncbi:sulfatase [Carboxylicivirga mesophila]|uniref:Sulfatase n=1 Tax=Carboxylicivirga mesophila TaxID=1166478 RepID=A0ABS5KE85_9BACT|nr:sulfatase [Carboxylicivirga mesophila]MBS2213296.1 sulfatase [Carboxylicivirga mesophila]